MSAVRDKEKTKEKILEAVSEIVLQEGIKNIGVNSVARKAGIDKVLIYRYFGGFQELLKIYIRKQDFFANITSYSNEKIDEIPLAQVKEYFKKLFLMQLSHLRHNKELQEILLWELTNKDEVTEFIADEREKVGIEILNVIKSKVPNLKYDIETFGTLMVCAINQVVLRSRTVNVFNGLNLSEEESWRRIEKMLENLIDLIELE